MLQSTLVLIVKNEENDILEWICHHSLIGFDKIIIYDNESTDNTANVIHEASNYFPVEYVLWKDNMQPVTGLTKQGAAYTHAIEQYRDSTKWMCFLDADEFLIPPKDETLPTLLEKMSPYKSFAINWVIFGSSNLEASENRLVLEAFTLRSDYSFPPNNHVKMFFQPAFTKKVINPHFIDVGEPAVNLNQQTIQWSQDGVTKAESHYQGEWRLHHYIIRSKEHWQRRVARKQPGGQVREWETFKPHDRNDILDYSAYNSAKQVWRKLFELDKHYHNIPDIPQNYIQPVPISPNIICFIDMVNSHTLKGWACDPTNNIPVTLHFYMNDHLNNSIECNLSRPDVKNSNDININHELVGFSCDLRTENFDNKPKKLTIFDQYNRKVQFYINGTLHQEYMFE